MHARLFGFDELRHDARWLAWGQLAAQAPPYLAPEFFALQRPFAPGESIVATSWTDAAMTGALPLALEGQTLRALRGEHSPGYDFCGTREGIEAIWACLRDDDRWAELVLDKVPDDSPLVTRLPALARADGCPAVVRPASRHPYFALPGFERRIKPKFRTNLQRCARKAGDVVYERIAVPTRADLEEATRIEAMAWKAAAGSSIDADPRAVHVYQVLARLLGRRGRASLAFLRVNGKRIATLFALEDGHTLFALKIGYDPHYANLSPGHLLVWKAAADAEQRGLVELDFVGREDEWKRKWTEEVHGQSLVVIYRRSPRGLVRYTLREVLKPRLPAALREAPHSPLPRGCQRADLVGVHTPLQRVRGRLDRGLGIKSRVKRVFRRRPPSARLGEPSVFAPGTWVRVRDAEQLHALLGPGDKTRGLIFVPAQWQACGQVFRVASQVRRIRDDHGRVRPVSRTVLLEGVDCAFGSTSAQAGCGRHCPLMFRDEWLEPAAAPHAAPPAGTQRFARVRDLAEITAGLDLFGRRDGLTFMPEMAAYAGRRLPILDRLAQVFEYDRWTAPPHAIYMLDGAHCTGAICRGGETCDRACTLLWHEAWLVLEPVTSA